MHADQIAAVERVREKAARKGVEGPVPIWLYAAMMLLEDAYGPTDADDIAALIVTGALAKWCDGNLDNDAWANLIIEGHDGRGPLLDRLLAATLARLDELPDKEKA